MWPAKPRMELFWFRSLVEIFSAVIVLVLLIMYALSAIAQDKEVNPYGVAVIIGNRNYADEQLPEVPYAHRDAEAFYSFALNVLGFNSRNIVNLRDATKADMEKTFGNEDSYKGTVWRFLHPHHGSDVIVFYSGLAMPGLRDSRGYLLPVDADPESAQITGYPIDLLANNIIRLEETRSAKVFLDTTFSGGSPRGALIKSTSSALLPVIVFETSKLHEDKFTVLIAASDGQIAYWDEGARHGVFTYHLLDALYGNADANEDEIVTAKEVQEYLEGTMTPIARKDHGRGQNARLLGSGSTVLAETPRKDAGSPRRTIPRK